MLSIFWLKMGNERSHTLVTKLTGECLKGKPIMNKKMEEIAPASIWSAECRQACSKHAILREPSPVLAAGGWRSPSHIS